MAELMYTGPTNRRAVVPEALRPKVLTAADLGRAFPIDWDIFVANQSRWLEVWNQQIAG
jgi:hypothetical protein